MSLFRADLHCHTTCSDGSLSVEELFSLAQQKGLQALSITDHDNVAAYKLAPTIAKQYGILLGSGVEFSAFFLGTSVHVLGYDFDLEGPSIKELCTRHKVRRQRRNEKILAHLKSSGMPLSEDDLPQEIVGRPHIAAAMVKKGHVPTIALAFHRYLGDGKACFEIGEQIGVEETISAIHEAGGKAFIAHPHLLKRRSLIRKLLQLPFDGLECYYARFPLIQEKRFLDLAREKGWLISGGSDFHHLQAVSLGSSWVDAEHFHKIFKTLL